jgi:hypothetical protein
MMGIIVNLIPRDDMVYKIAYSWKLNPLKVSRYTDTV